MCIRDSNVDVSQSSALSKIIGGVMLGVIVLPLPEKRLHSYGIVSILCTAMLLALGQNTLIFKVAAQASSIDGKYLLFQAMPVGSTLRPL